MRLVFFDLDGTITRRDSLTPYVLGWLLRHPWRLPRLLAVAPAALRFLLVARNHGELKAALLHHTMRGCRHADIESWNAAFVPELLRRGVFASALQAIRRHHDAGDHLVLMSASVDLYVPAIGEALGFNETVCTAVRWDGEQLDGRLAGTNCRGEEKLRQMERLKSQYPGAQVTAYGNSAPDLPHLLAADHAILVNPSRALRAPAEHRGIEMVNWR